MDEADDLRGDLETYREMVSVLLEQCHALLTERRQLTERCRFLRDQLKALEESHL